MVNKIKINGHQIANDEQVRIVFTISNNDIKSFTELVFEKEGETMQSIQRKIRHFASTMRESTKK